MINIIYVCLKIFFARIVDVSLGSIRTVLMVKGRSKFAAIIAFIEVFIWFIVAKEALSQEFDSLLIPIFYSAGYATGTLLGTYISNNFLDGIMGVQVITTKNNKKLLKEIRNSGFGVSVVDLKDDYENLGKDMLIIQLNKKRLKALTQIIKRIDKQAFIIINETKYVQNGFIK